jgi:hypothetical protein
VGIVVLAATLGAALGAAIGPAVAAPETAASLPPPCDDETFLRRVSLDLIGRQPTPAAIEAFVADASADKRAVAVERLLADPRWATNWARYFRDVILYRRSNDQAAAMAGPLEAFFAERLRDGAGWDVVARDMITALGRPREHGETAIIFAQMGETADIAAEVSRVFLGIQIQCAQCHDHFTDRWRRPQFHEFAAFFPRIAIQRGGDGKGLDQFEVVSFDRDPRRGRKPAMPNPRRGELEHAMPDLDDPSLPGTVMTPAFFLTDAGMPLGTPDQERRAAVARWITAPEANPWFARAIVNRLWTELVGDGFYAGIDDLGPDREPRDADTLDALCHTFTTAGHDLRTLFREIMATPAYQATSRSRQDVARAAVGTSCPQRLRADQLFTQILAALDVEETTGKGGRGRRDAAQKPVFKGGGARDGFNRVFGYDPSLPREEVSGSIPQALLLMNGPQLAAALDGTRPGSPLGRLLREFPDDRDLIEEIYLRTLARRPTPADVDTCLAHMQAVGRQTAGGQAAGGANTRGEAFADIFWALVNSAEFVHRK